MPKGEAGTETTATITLNERETTFLLGLLDAAESYAESRLGRDRDPEKVLQAAALYLSRVQILKLKILESI